MIFNKLNLLLATFVCMDFLTLPTFAADTFIVTFYPADGDKTKVEGCMSSAAFIQSQILPKYAVETMVEKDVSLEIASYVAGVTSISPYVSLYSKDVTSMQFFDSMYSTSTSASMDVMNDSVRRLPCTTCSCRCADSVSTAKYVYGCPCNRRRRLGEKSLSVVAKDVLDTTESEDKGRGLQSVGSKDNILIGDGMYTATEFYAAVANLDSTNSCRSILLGLSYKVDTMSVDGLFM